MSQTQDLEKEVGIDEEIDTEGILGDTVVDDEDIGDDTEEEEEGGIDDDEIDPFKDKWEE